MWSVRFKKAPSVFQARENVVKVAVYLIKIQFEIAGIFVWLLILILSFVLIFLFFRRALLLNPVFVQLLDGLDW